MSLENLVTEVKAKSASQVADVRNRTATERKTLEDGRDKEIARVRAEQIEASEREVHREVTRVMAAAALQSKKVQTEAAEHRLDSGYRLLLQRLQAYVKTPEYNGLLTRMAETGVSVLGSEARLVVREEDVAKLPANLQSLVVPKQTLRSMGGLVVQSQDGRRRLDMTFEELLRWKEDTVREILSRK